MQRCCRFMRGGGSVQVWFGLDWLWAGLRLLYSVSNSSVRETATFTFTIILSVYCIHIGADFRAIQSCVWDTEPIRDSLLSACLRYVMTWLSNNIRLRKTNTFPKIVTKQLFLFWGNSEESQKPEMAVSHQGHRLWQWPPTSVGKPGLKTYYRVPTVSQT